MKVGFDKDFPDVAIIKPKIFGDSRGSFSEVFNERKFQNEVADYRFVQDNESISYLNVIRGLHYQLPHPQGKLVRVLKGVIKDLVLDLRRNSETFGKHKFFTLLQGVNWLWIPPGFAHGFIATVDSATVLYKTTDFYYPECEKCIHFGDSSLRIDWACSKRGVTVSDKDGAGSSFTDAEVYEDL